MSKYGKYIPGDRYVLCAVCDCAYRLSEIRKGITGKQKGLAICPVCFDPLPLPATKLSPARPLAEVR